jgi:hypothetical protein
LARSGDQQELLTIHDLVRDLERLKFSAPNSKVRGLNRTQSHLSRRSSPGLLLAREDLSDIFRNSSLFDDSSYVSSGDGEFAIRGMGECEQKMEFEKEKKW